MNFMQMIPISCLISTFIVLKMKQFICGHLNVVAMKQMLAELVQQQLVVFISSRNTSNSNNLQRNAALLLLYACEVVNLRLISNK